MFISGRIYDQNFFRRFLSPPSVFKISPIFFFAKVSKYLGLKQNAALFFDILVSKFFGGRSVEKNMEKRGPEMTIIIPKLKIF